MKIKALKRLYYNGKMYQVGQEFTAYIEDARSMILSSKAEAVIDPVQQAKKTEIVEVTSKPKVLKKVIEPSYAIAGTQKAKQKSKKK